MASENWRGAADSQAALGQPALPASFIGILWLVGCGGGNGGGGGSKPPPVDGTPAGAYTVLVTGTANGIVHNAVVNVVVQ